MSTQGDGGQTEVSRGSGRRSVIADRYHLSRLDNIKFRLAEENEGLLEKSCFGKLMALCTSSFHRSIYEEMLKRLDRHSLGTHTLIFEIKGARLAFGPVEFAIMTGLRFTGSHCTPVSSDLHDMLFDSRPSISLFNIQETFDAECTRTEGAGQSCLKLAMLCILYGLLLTKGPVTDQVPMEYFHLVDNLEAFNAFPWGLVAYNFLVRSTHEASARYGRLICKEEDDDCPNPVIAPGLSVVLIFGAYEVLPRLGTICGLVNHPGIRLPRMVYWTTDDFLQEERMRRFFLDDGEEMDILQMTPTWDESVALNAHGPAAMVRPFLENSQQADVGSMSRMTRPDANVDRGLQHLRERLMADFSDAADTPSRHVLGSEAEFNIVPARGGRSRGRSTGRPRGRPPGRGRGRTRGGGRSPPSRGDERLDGNMFMRLDPNCRFANTGLRSIGVRRYPPARPMFISSPDPVPAPPHHRLVPRCLNDSPHTVTPPTHVAATERVFTERLLTLERILLNLCSSPGVLANQTTPQPATLSISSPLVHDRPSDDARYYSQRRLSFDNFIAGQGSVHSSPGLEFLNAATFDDDPTFRSFVSWYKHEADSPHHKMECGVPRKWFDQLWNPDGWLQDQHLDVLLVLFVIQTRFIDATIVDRWSFLSTTCWSVLACPDENRVDACVLPFVLGALHSDWSVGWDASRKIVGIGHLRTNHWVAYSVSIDEQRITVYDSAPSGPGCEFVHAAFQSIARHVPLICQKAGITPPSESGRENWARSFEVVVDCSCLQQANGADCGVMALQYIECVVRGRPFASIMPRMCSYLRKAYCASIFEYALGVIRKKGNGEIPH